jgi:myo-inositol-1-phosphate synthase
MATNKIRIAIVGVGNCASSLIQGIHLYRNSGLERIPGLLHKEIGKYRPGDIEVVAAFDIDTRKVGKDVAKAIFQKPNNTSVFCADIPATGTIVERGPTLDGLPSHLENYDEDVRPVESKAKPVDVAAALIKAKPDLLISYLPVGSQKATEYYVDACLKAGVSFVNAVPVFICSTDTYAKKFAAKKLLCAGDDIKSQVGATITHRVLTDLFEKRGVRLTKTYQLNVGGNTDFLNMLDRSRLKQKKESKTEAVQSQLEKPLSGENIHIGPSDFIPFLKDNKVAFIRMEGEGFGGLPIELELRLSVEDSPNSAGVMIDVIRLMKLAQDSGMTGYLDEVSSFAFKHPRRQYTDSEIFERLEDFIKRLS